jgi:AraC-like DNA-binding protein
MWWNPEPGAAIGDGVTVFPLVRDRLLLVPPHVSITHHLASPTHSFALHVELDEPMAPLGDELFYPGLSADMIERLEQIPKMYPEGILISARDSKAPVLGLLLGEIVCRSFQYLPPHVWEVSRKDARIEDALATLQQRRIQGCPNDELAEQAHLSTNAFIRLFKREVGVSPQAHLQNIRLDHAAHLLQHSDDSVEQIAAECGFCDRYYLSKLFKRRFFVGPARYRRG